MADGTLKVGTITTSSGSGTITIPSGVSLNAVDGVTGVANTPAFNAKNSSNQSITRATKTKMTLGTEVFDTDNAFASSKFTVPSGEAGKYMIIGRIQGINTENERVMCFIYKNGSQFERTENAGKASDGSADTDVFSVDIMDLSVGDYIELYAQVNGSGSADVFGILEGYKLIG